MPKAQDLPHPDAAGLQASSDFIEMVGYRQIAFLARTSLAASKRGNHRLGNCTLTRGVLAAVEDSGIDLTDCTCDADVTAAVLVYLVAGRRALEKP